MSAQGMTALYERLESDEAFRTRLEEARSPADKHRLVAAEGFDVDSADFSTLRSLAGANELSDEDLERVAGGSGTGTATAGAAVSIGSVAAAAFAAIAL